MNAFKVSEMTLRVFISLNHNNRQNRKSSIIIGSDIADFQNLLG